VAANVLPALLSSPWATIPAALVFILALARLARLRPIVRPLVGPFALCVLALAALSLLPSTRSSDAAWLALLVLLPLLVLLVRVAVLVFQALFRRRHREGPPALLDSLVAVLLYGVGAGIIARNWFGIELTPFLATSAVVGAVVGLALQDTLGNLFAGIALHTEAPFRVGDWVRVSDRDGRVEQVSWRATRLRTWDGDTLTIPNNEVARHVVLNYSLPATTHSRVVAVGVNYNTPPNKVITVLRGLCEQIESLVQEPPPGVRIIGYHDFTIHYEMRYHVKRYEDYRHVEGEIHRLIWYHFRRHGIEIPFPIRNVYLHPVESTGDAREATATRLERALRNIDLFRPLADEELAVATSRFRQLHYAAGERIIEEGSPGDSFFVIDRGEVEVSKVMAGARRTLARLMEGQFFGEMALLTGEPRAATIVAKTDVDLFTIDKGGFHGILVANPAIAVDISTILAERREALSQAEGDLTARYEEARSASELRARILDRIRGYFGI
jgi:small-conductance mechanosensitive channel/CRP-like cAMP-binding protein